MAVKYGAFIVIVCLLIAAIVAVSVHYKSGDDPGKEYAYMYTHLYQNECEFLVFVKLQLD